MLNLKKKQQQQMLKSIEMLNKFSISFCILWKSTMSNTKLIYSLWFIQKLIRTI